MASNERFVRCHLEFESGALGPNTPLEIFYEIEEKFAVLFNKVRIEGNLYTIKQVNAPK